MDHEDERKIPVDELRGWGRYSSQQSMRWRREMEHDIPETLTVISAVKVSAFVKVNVLIYHQL